MKLDPLFQSTCGFCASDGRHLELAVTLVKATLELNYAGLYNQATIQANRQSRWDSSGRHTT
eukprot:1369687-Pleurochrysis_carterae.AAC.1